jgi:hypothetical protein
MTVASRSQPPVSGMIHQARDLVSINHGFFRPAGTPRFPFPRNPEQNYLSVNIQVNGCGAEFSRAGKNGNHGTPRPSLAQDLMTAADGELPECRAPKVLEHLEACPACRERLHSLEQTLSDFVHVRARARTAQAPHLRDGHEQRRANRPQPSGAVVSAPLPERPHPRDCTGPPSSTPAPCHAPQPPSFTGGRITGVKRMHADRAGTVSRAPSEAGGRTWGLRQAR